VSGGPGFGARLAVAAVAYNVVHHLGALPGGLGEVGDTRVVDWIELLSPFVVLGTAAWALAAASGLGAVVRDGPRGVLRRWVAFGAGAVLYAQGQGIHLAANSIGNVAPSSVVHLWDEVVGHVVWYSGAAVVLAVLATATAGRPRPGGWPGLAGAALALAVGGTWVTNAAGGSYAVPGLVVALGLGGYGWRHRDGLAGLLAVAFLPAAVALAAYLAVQAAG
jgi:hypothetical protein